MKHDKITLPIKIDNIECVTECWTHNRMIVLKTSPYYEDWIASHYDIYTTNQYNFRFGETWMYTPDYYDAILESKPLQLLELTRENLIKNLKEEFQKGYYINMVIKPIKERESLHEVLFYGYDDEREALLAIIIANRSFHRMEYSYEYLEETLCEIQENFRSRKRRGMELSIQYQNPIYAFRLREDYPVENCVFHAYRKLITEVEGICFQEGKRNESWVFRVCSKVYRGISCLCALTEMIHEVMAGKELDPGCQGMTIAVQKLYEHRCMVIISMKYIQRKWDKAMKPQSTEYILKYTECGQVVEKWVKLMLKYEITGDEAILKRILAEIPGIYEKEYEILNKFINECIDWDSFNKNYI